MIESIFEEGGWLAQHLPNYKVRPGQMELAQAIDESLVAEKHILAEGPTGCHAKGQEILMYDGTIKKVEDIKVNDSLMGPDSRVRTVLQLCSGRERMIRIQPRKGEMWTVNQNHILTLVRTGTLKRVEGGRRKDYKGNTTVDVRVVDYEEWSGSQKHLHKLFRTGVVFDPPSCPVTLDPYFLGMYLGDGSTSSGSVGVCTADVEVVSYLQDFAKQYGLGLRIAGTDRLAPSYYIRDEHHSGSARNPVIGELRELGLYRKVREGKFIPHHYKISSIEDRLELLAGLIDSDGHLTCNCYEVVSGSPTLARDILFLARSLGFSANSSKKAVNGKEYDRILISGEVYRIPCRINRKKAQKRKQKKSVLRTGFKIEEAGEDDFYGFSLSGDGRFLLGDFTVTHNTGKSLAYGIPAAIHALSTGGTVVIVTANITLQEQLFHKDLPLIAQVLEDLEFEGGAPTPSLDYKLIKGMANYVCKDKLIELGAAGCEESWFEDISGWEEDSETGDKSELPVEYPADIWSNVASTSDECTKGECKFFESCYVFRARQGTTPHVVVTNYHMLYTDFLVREATGGQVAILPDHRVLVMDEAHEATDIAMSFNGFEVTQGKLKWMARALTKVRSSLADDKHRMLVRCTDSFFSQLSNEDSTDIIRRPLGYDGGLVHALRDSATFIQTHTSLGGAGSEDERRAAARLRALISSFVKLANNVEDAAFGVTNDYDTKVLPSGSVFFVERDRRKGTQSLCCKVVEVQRFLREHIFSRKTAVGVSATLATNQNFKFIAKELGLNKDEFNEMIIPTPFDPERVLVVIPDLPVPKKRDEHTQAVAEVVDEIARSLQGKTMALFTSYRALKEVDKYVRNRNRTVKILTQGEMPKSRIIAIFKEEPHALILATASFWQGVDIPGEALSCLIIDKFPFMPPSDPVLKYLEEALSMDGRSAFFEYSVPKAIISLKQGVGRLIRTETDFGAVVLCDNRIDSTGYGKQFLRAFPEGHFRSENGDIRDVKAFLDEMRRNGG